MIKIKNPGFTLVEVLVATVISVGMLTLVMGSFWTLWQTYRTSELMQEMQHEATFAMTRISDKIRDKGVDYAAYTDVNLCEPNVNERLCLDNGTFIKYEDQQLFMGTHWQQDPLFSVQKFAVTSLYFERFPTEKPVRSRTDIQFQPKVSIYLTLTNRYDIWGREIDLENNLDEALSLSLQTTISSRDYNF